MNWDVFVMIVHRAFLVQKSIIVKKLQPLVQSVFCPLIRRQGLSFVQWCAFGFLLPSLYYAGENSGRESRGGLI